MGLNYFSAREAKLKACLNIQPVHRLITFYKKTKLQPLNATSFTVSEFESPPTFASPNVSSVSFIRPAWLRPLSAPLCLSDTRRCDLSVRALTYTRYWGDHISLHFSGQTRKVPWRSLLSPVSRGADHIHTTAKRHRFAFTLSSMMAAQDFNFLLATDSYKVRTTCFEPFNNRNPSAWQDFTYSDRSPLCFSRRVYVQIKPTLTLWIDGI